MEKEEIRKSIEEEKDKFKFMHDFCAERIKLLKDRRKSKETNEEIRRAKDAKSEAEYCIRTLDWVLTLFEDKKEENGDQ